MEEAMATILVKDVCEKHWDQWKGDCSGFLKAVASDLGITLTGQANAIIDAMGRDPWEQLGTDADQAVNHAGMAYLVVAGLKATPNGHVVVIVPGPAKPYPTGYWGRLHGVGRKNTTINWAWDHTDLPNVKYFAVKL
jgi:hypothetical protein